MKQMIRQLGIAVLTPFAMVIARDDNATEGLEVLEPLTGPTRTDSPVQLLQAKVIIVK